MSQSTVNKKYDIWLDLLRIVAMLGVVAVHLGPRIGMTLTRNGASCVYIFFTLSGFLAIQSFHRKPKAADYYLGRVVNILVPYYFVIVLAMIWVGTAAKYSVSILDLRWLRYFLGVNMLTMTDDYTIWNNLYGWWTMSSCILFYVLVPLINKLIKNRKIAYISVLISFLFYVAIKIVGGRLGIYDQADGEQLNIMLGSSIYATFIYFAVGIYTYFCLKENKLKSGLIGNAILCIGGVCIHRTPLVWSAATGLFILITQSNKFNVINSVRNNKLIRVISKNSYGIYLSHMFVFDMCATILESKLGDNHYTLIWLVMSSAFIVSICIMVNIVLKLANVKYKAMQKY